MVDGVRYLPIETFDTGPRGLLSVLGNQGIGVPIVRTFWISHVGMDAVRGGHAHRETTQVLAMMSGGADLLIEGAGCRVEFRLSPQLGCAVVVPPLHWVELRNWLPGSVLSVHADTPYLEADYIRDRAEFDRLIGAKS